MKRIELNESVYARNNGIAQEVRRALDARGIRMYNLLGTPGSGKTTLLEQLLRCDNRRIAVIEGDLFTDEDAQRIRACNVQAVQLNTQGACHLEADAVAQALGQLDLDGIDTIVVDNVGNLVCTAEFSLGEHRRIAVISVTEGNDKPRKYPLIFRTSDIVVLNKMDLLPYTNFDPVRFARDVRQLNPRVEILSCAAVRGEGVQELRKRLTGDRNKEDG